MNLMTYFVSVLCYFLKMLRDIIRVFIMCVLFYNLLSNCRLIHARLWLVRRVLALFRKGGRDWNVCVCFMKTLSEVSGHVPLCVCVFAFLCVCLCVEPVISLDVSQVMKRVVCAFQRGIKSEVTTCKYLGWCRDEGSIITRVSETCLYIDHRLSSWRTWHLLCFLY